MTGTTVLISGASIAGPALAYWLHRYGFEVTVVERAPAPRPGGQAVDFKGQAHVTVLERMGILDEVRARQTGGADMVFVDETDRPRASLSADFTGGDVEILRGDLADIMYRKTAEVCTYLFGDSIRTLTDTGSGVTVEFEHGPTRTFDLVLGADGTHSRVRALTFGPERDFVRHHGYYYCIASPGASGRAERPGERSVSYAHNTPGRLAVSSGPGGDQLYMFAAPELTYDRTDEAAQRRLVTDTFAGMGWRVPDMLTEMASYENFYLDALAQVRMRGYVRGRVALVGDAGYGNTLAGFGTGLAVVGAYVLAGELALADGDHTIAYPRYEETMRRYTKLAGASNPGRFLTPKTGYGIRVRDWFLGSRLFDLMDRYAANAKEDIALLDYPALHAERKSPAGR